MSPGEKKGLVDDSPVFYTPHYPVAVWTPNKEAVCNPHCGEVVLDEGDRACWHRYKGAVCKDAYQAA